MTRLVIVAGLVAAAATAVAAQPAPVDARLVALTEEAREQARAGRCTTVVATASHVLDRNAAYYQTVFLVDPEIARCVARDARSATTAVVSSIVATVAGGAAFLIGLETRSTGLTWVGAGVGAVGPSVGHIYAGSGLSAGLGIRAASVAVGALGAYVTLVVACSDGCVPSTHTEGQAILVVAGIGYVGGMIYEIATGAGAAHRANRDRGLELTPSLVPTAGGGVSVGVAFGGRW